MVTKEIYKYSDVQEKILQAIDMIADPVRQTLSPKGSNVIFEDDRGNINQTNDGVTIARSIVVEDPVQNAIISILKHSSAKTNSEAGDGTTTTLLLSQRLIKEGFKLIDNGMNPMVLKKKLETMGSTLIKSLSKQIIKIKNDDDLMNIAIISANNDKDIAKNVVEVIKFAGEDGMIFIEPNNDVETKIEKEPGFKLDSGMLSPDLRTNPSSFTATYKKVPVLITDKRLYYSEEAEHILQTVLKAGYKEVVVIARDFIGQAPGMFIGTHQKGTVKCLLVKDNRVTENNSETLDDLATYLGGTVIKEKRGSLVNKITIKDFCIAEQVFSDQLKTIITPIIENKKGVHDIVTSLKEELKKDKENAEIKRRIACLTSGTTKVKVGGATPIEISEKIYRYEDAINATRTANKYGYIVGGGIALLKTFNPKDYDEDIRNLTKKYTEASIRQIAENCGKHEDHVIETVMGGDKNYGYNALTDTYEDILVAGVVDPYKVTEMAILNSVSVANIILSSKYLIVNKIETNEK